MFQMEETNVVSKTTHT